MLRHRELLDRALEMFLERGFANTTIRDVAAAVGMTRRTVYARYADKRELFRATLEHGVDRVALPQAALDAADTGDLRSTLVALARLRVDTSLTPIGIQLQRFVHAESYRFPDLVRGIYARISQPTTERIATLLDQSNKRGETEIGDTVWAARCLLSMTVGAPLTMALVLGLKRIEDLEQHIQHSVDLFLNGVRSQSRACF